MAADTKLKVSLTLSGDLVALVDRDARRQKSTRSGIVELWLRRAATAAIEKEIEESTLAYYQSLRENGREEDDELPHALSRASRKVRYETEPFRRRGRSR